MQKSKKTKNPRTMSRKELVKYFKQANIKTVTKVDETGKKEQIQDDYLQEINSKVSRFNKENNAKISELLDQIGGTY